MNAYRLYVVIATICCNDPVCAYQPPQGIPDPASYFGVLNPIDAPKPDTRVHCPGWHATVTRANTRAAGDDRDAYYIDKNHPAATDSGNTYGYPSRPRTTVPSKEYLAGDYIEVHGDGNPEALASTYAGTFNPRGVGTDIAPIWFVGVGQPVFSGALNMGFSNSPRISFMVFDGLHWRGGGSVTVRPRYANNTIDHIVFRRCKIIGTRTVSDVFGLNVTNNSPAYSDQTVKQVVFYGGEVGHIGDPNSPQEEICVNVGYCLTFFWVLESDIHHAAEDGFLFSHLGKRTSKHLYVGRNVIHENTTNGMDLKGVGGPVVISENQFYGHKDVWVDGVHKSSGIGETCVFHYAGSSTGPDSYLNYPEDVSFIFNTVMDGRMGVATSDCGKLRIIGNIFNRSRRQPTNYNDSPFCLDLRGIKGDTWICHNTIYDCEGSIRTGDGPGIAYNASTTYYIGYKCSYGGKSYIVFAEPVPLGGVLGVVPTDSRFWKEVNLYMYGNIVANTFGGAADLKFDSSQFFSNVVRSGYNCVYNPAPGGVVLSGCSLNPTDIRGNPLLVNPGAGNFLLGPTSPCIDTGVEGGDESAYDDFLSSFGFQIKVDRNGGPRPQGLKWDIGACEYGNSVVPSFPPPGQPKVEILPNGGP